MDPPLWNGVIAMTIKIPLSHITPEGVSVSSVKQASDFSVLKEMLAAGEVSDFSVLEIEVTLTERKGYYDVTGKVAGRVGLTCSRCLESFSHPLHQRFKLRFSQEIPMDLDPDEDANLELTADQMGLLFFKGDELDLGDAVQEQVILALPLKPLCSAACKGLCPKCGADLNLGPCGCGGNGGGSPFDVLKSLKLK